MSDKQPNEDVTVKDSKEADTKPILETKFALALLVILLIIALVLPIGIFHGPDYGNFPHFYKCHNKTPESNATHIYIEPLTEGFIRIDLDVVPDDTKKHRFERDLHNELDESVNMIVDFGNELSLPFTEFQKVDHHQAKKNTHKISKRAISAISTTSKEDEKQYFEEAYESYLQCMEGRDENYYLKMVSTPFISLGGEEEPIKLKCNLCIRPDQDPNLYNIKWRRFLKMSLNQTWEDLPDDQDRFEVEMETGDLTLTDMLEEDSGRYVCNFRGNIFESVHYVDIMIHERTRQVFDDTLTSSTNIDPSSGNKTDHTKLPKAAEAEPVEHLNLWLSTKWGEWSRCSRCGTRGERARHGQCMVKLVDQDLDTDFEILKRFPDGIPCRSSLIPYKLAEAKELKERYSENEVGYCSEECPAGGQQVMAEDGSPVTILKNKFGFKKPKMFKLPKLVIRRVYYVIIGDKTALKCPKVLNGQAVRWMNGSNTYDRVQLAQDPEHRVGIDTALRLVIHDLRAVDSSVYACYADGKLRASMKLKVVPPYKEEKVSDWVTTTGIIGSILFVGYMAYMLFAQERKYGKVMR